MARREVIEVQCDLCGRTETQSKEEAGEHKLTELFIRYHDDEAQFSDLCKRCRESCRNYFDRIRLVKEDKEDGQEDATPETPEPAKKRGLLSRS